MQPPPRSSSAAGEPDELAITILVACHHRGPLTVSELSRLLSAGQTIDASAEGLVGRGLLETRGSRYAVTQTGRELLDRVLESIESQLSPDSPEYVRRYQRQAPTIPFDANTVWEEAIAANFQVDPATLRPLIPEPFDLDLYRGKAFVSLVASRLKGFGVGRLPRALRMNFYQVTYRAHVTYTDFRGRTTRGCYFVRSETNSSLMSLSANMLPEFRAHHCSTYPILMVRQGGNLVLTVDSGVDPAGKVVLVLDTSRQESVMPASSAFPSRQAAYDFLVDIRDGFSYAPETGEVYILQIDRGDWDIQIVHPVDHYLGYFVQGPFGPGVAQLDSVFYFRDVPYRWLPLVKEKIKHQSAGVDRAASGDGAPSATQLDTMAMSEQLCRGDAA